MSFLAIPLVISARNNAEITFHVVFINSSHGLSQEVRQCKNKQTVLNVTLRLNYFQSLKSLVSCWSTVVGIPILQICPAFLIPNTNQQTFKYPRATG